MGRQIPSGRCERKVLEHMQVMYKENPGEFIYFVTMYNIFRDYLDELTEENIVQQKHAQVLKKPKSGINYTNSKKMQLSVL